MHWILSQATQPVVSSMTVEQIAIRVGLWTGAALAVLAGAFKVVQYAIGQWFDTKKMWNQQQAMLKDSSNNARAILNINEKMQASESIPSPDQSVMEPVRETAQRGTGDGGLPIDPTPIK